MSVPAMKMHVPLTLAELLRGFADAPHDTVLGIASDSRKVQAGFLFFACAGSGRHGLDFLAEAVAAGACAIAWDRSTGRQPDEVGIPLIAIDDLASHLGEIANRFYASPSQSLSAVGITGTNGKTTVAWLIAASLNYLQRPCAYLGTLGVGLDDLTVAEEMTTPGVIEMQAHLADFVAQGAVHAALEVSSHALAQGRVDGIDFDTVLFTNLSRDHLDYHGDMRRYFDAKARLFLQSPSNNKIVNIDSEFGAELAERCANDVVIVSCRIDRPVDSRTHVIVRSASITPQGTVVSFVSSWGDGSFTLSLPGDFNIENATLVLAYLLNKGVEIPKACDLLGLLTAPAGRMQRIASLGAAVYVDYAHSPVAIESALQALRPRCSGRLWCVFGCGGERDEGKRALMGAAAERDADKVLVTNDNPRGEDAQKIIGDILEGMSGSESVVVIEDRAAAIGWAIENAGPTDVILIAGKGHEDYQDVGGTRLPFSDAAVAMACVRAKEARHD